MWEASPSILFSLLCLILLITAFLARLPCSKALLLALHVGLHAILPADETQRPSVRQTSHLGLILAQPG